MKHELGNGAPFAAPQAEPHDSVPSSIGTPVPQVLTAQDVARLMKVSPKTVYKLKDCDGLPAHRFGGSVRFYLSEVLEWMEAQPRQ